MNYDQRFAQLIADIKNDKGITQPWRNKAIGRIDEGQALLEKGQRSTNMKPPEDMAPQALASAGNPNQNIYCICPAYPDMRDKSCPIHGN